jgi:hypothetical protein
MRASGSVPKSDPLSAISIERTSLTDKSTQAVNEPGILIPLGVIKA